MKISVIGTGYVGLVAGACFSDTGNEVTCVDTDRSKIERLKAGEIPIYEPGLETLVKRGYQEGRLKFTTSVVEGVAEAEVIFMAVGTPAGEDGEPNLTYLKAASEDVARALKRPAIIVNKSTVPIGSHQVVAQWMKPLAQVDFDVVSNPEFLKEGSAIDDFLKPDRVVIGTDKEPVFKKMAELYAPFVRQGNPIIWMDAVSAELTKYACNSFLATRISFMNELSRLCDSVGGDIEKVRKGMATDQRIGKHFLYAGVGYGGSCFPKDIQALAATARKKNVPLSIVEATESANERQKSVLVDKIVQFFGSDGAVSGKTFAVWGLAFKPNTDDMREAPALVVINELTKRGAKIRAFDPVALTTARKAMEEEMPRALDQVQLCATAMEAVQGADALLLVTEWNEFRHVDFDAVKQRLKSPVLFDGRNLYEPEAVKRQGFRYFGIGRS